MRGVKLFPAEPTGMMSFLVFEFNEQTERKLKGTYTNMHTPTHTHTHTYIHMNKGTHTHANKHTPTHPYA